MIWVRLFIIGILAFCVSSDCFAKSAGLDYEYAVFGVSVAKDGYYLIEVSVLVDKKKDVNINVAKQYALQGCLYKGFVVGRIFQKPIVDTPLNNDKQADYIYSIVTRDYDSYTTSSHPLQVVKVGKQFRVKAIILVAKDALRQNLEEAGILRKLGL